MILCYLTHTKYNKYICLIARQLGDIKDIFWRRPLEGYLEKPPAGGFVGREALPTHLPSGGDTPPPRGDSFFSKAAEKTLHLLDHYSIKFILFYIF
jgi:hypothetical protein